MLEERLVRYKISRFGQGHIKNRPTIDAFVKYNDVENEFFHPWALPKRLYDYGYYKLSEIFGTPNEFLATRADLVDLIKDNVRKGAEQRLKDDKAKEPADKSEISGLSREIQEMIKKPIA